MAKKTVGEYVSDWWQGDTKLYDSPYILGFYTERHWTSDVAHALWEFYLRHWQWIWSAIIALASLWVAILALK